MPFEPVQYERLAALIVELKRRYPIEAVVGHADIAPGGRRIRGDFSTGIAFTRWFAAK